MLVVNNIIENPGSFLLLISYKLSSHINNISINLNDFLFNIYFTMIMYFEHILNIL